MTHTHSIAIIGLGYVGMPLAQLLISKGFKVVGIDIDDHKVKLIESKISYITDLNDKDIADMIDSGLFRATTHYSAVEEVQSIIICVPTPLDHRAPDLSYVFSAASHLAPYLKEGQLVVLESSTYPGTTEEEVRPLLEQGGKKVGENIFLGYSPERIDPGNIALNLATMPKVISGVTARCLEHVTSLYNKVFVRTVPVSSPRIAEFCKLLENGQRFINISYMNELNLLAHKMDVDLWEVIEAAKTKPFGFSPYYPSPGIGGHCIPVDPYFLAWVGMREGISLGMIERAGHVNEMIPFHVVNRAIKALVNKNIHLDEAKVGIIGLTYKKDVNDIRESAAIKVIEQLIKRRISVSVYDPYYTKEIAGTEGRFELTREELQAFDLILILVDHSSIAWQYVVANSRCIIDTRNVTKQWSYDTIIRM